MKPNLQYSLDFVGKLFEFHANNFGTKSFNSEKVSSRSASIRRTSIERYPVEFNLFGSEIELNPFSDRKILML